MPDGNNRAKSQSEITRGFEVPCKKQNMHRAERKPNISIYLGSSTLDHLTALGLIDDTTIATQIQRAVQDYIVIRKDDPAMEGQMADYDNRSELLRELSETFDAMLRNAGGADEFFGQNE